MNVCLEILLVWLWRWLLPCSDLIRAIRAIRELFSMKAALDQTGSLIEADAGAPGQAICPHCGAVVIPRRRRRNHPPGDVVYFWRHRDRDNTHCPARFAAGAMIRKNE
jgi:hypothetical protein